MFLFAQGFQWGIRKFLVAVFYVNLRLDIFNDKYYTWSLSRSQNHFIGTKTNTVAQKHKVTLKQIAQKVGCSHTAVSVVLGNPNGNSGVGPDLRRRIEAAAKRMGYETNYHAQALRAGKANALGLMFGAGSRSQLQVGFFSRMIAGLDEFARSRNHDLVIVGSGPGEGHLNRGVQYINRRRIDALIIPGVMYPEQVLNRDDRPMPVVAAIPPPGKTFYPAVDLDYGPGLKEAVRLFREKGHRDVLAIHALPDTHHYTEGRVKDFCRLAREAGMEAEMLCLESSQQGEGGSRLATIRNFRERFALWLEKNECPGAILAHNELNGIGIYQALAAKGLAVPRDVSLIAFDDIWADLTVPPMTVISTHLDKVGQEAGALALDILDDSSWVDDPPRRYVSASLVPRESVGPARG